MSDGRITVGDVEIIGISDAIVDFPMTLDRLFASVPPEAWDPYRQRYPGVFGATPTTWRLDFGSYILRSRGRTILIDTGVGPASAPMPSFFLKCDGQLLPRMRAQSIDPDEVDTVIITHLHADHVGWNVIEDDGHARLAFPRARYVVHRADWEAFHTPEAQAAFPFPFVERTIDPLERLSALELIDGDRSISEAVTVLHTPGHTPGSISVLVNSGGERALMWGDVIVHPAQITEDDWAFWFDMDQAEAGDTRRQLLDRAEAEGMTVMACHFPEPGFGRVVRLEGRRYWQGF